MALSFKQLCELFDCKQAASLRRVLKSRGIKWSRDRKGRPWTTEAELDRALSAEKRQMTFTKPPRVQCKKKPSPSLPASVRSTDLGTSSSGTNGQSYAE